MILGIEPNWQTRVARVIARAPGGAALLLTAVFFMLLAVPAKAQIAPPPYPSAVDERGVDLISGQVIASVTDVAIGPDDHRGLRFERQFVGSGWRIANVPTISGSTSQPIVSFGGQTVIFNSIGGQLVPRFPDGSTLVLGTSSSVFTSSDGVVVEFGLPDYGYTMFQHLSGKASLGTKITFPDGIEWHFHYNQATITYNGFNSNIARLAAVTSSAGYLIKLTYQTDTLPSQPFATPWSRLIKVTALNRAVEHCDPLSCTPSSQWPSATYPSEPQEFLEYYWLPASVTDAGNRTTNYSYISGGSGFPLAGIQAPGEPADTVSFTYGGNYGYYKVAEVTAGGSTWTYDYSQDTQNQLDVTTVTDLLSNATTIKHSGSIRSVTAGGQTTAYEYCAGETGCPSLLLKTVTMPEGNKVTYGYDSRGNTTSTTYIAKSGSGLANIATSATYDTSCLNQKTCNKPTSTTDAGGNVTNFTYDASTGLITKVEAPAATSGGPRPTTNYAYASKQARYLTGASTWANSSATVLTESNTCRTAATCAGSADQMRTILSYPSSTTPNNLQPSSIEVRNGTGSLSSTTTPTYDSLGRTSTIDGPRNGTNDQTAVFYDAAGMVIGQIGPDPDGIGGNPRSAVRYSYNIKGQLTTTESGTVTALTQAALDAMTASFKSVRSYDDHHRLAKEAQVATSGATQYSLVQYSYDAAGRPECTALRMNAPLTSTTLPASACTPMTAGSYGPDRITKQIYNASGQPSETRAGVGSALEQAVSTVTYTNNGQVETVTDANGNTTKYTYDGHDRPLQTQYPSELTGAPNTSDYEALTYGTSGNDKGRVTQVRTRLGESFTFVYDLLGRTKQMIVPERSGLATTHTRDVYYTYNVAGDLTGARFDSTSGLGITFAYDAFGRQTSSSNSMFASTKTHSYAYNAAGNRTSITHPDNKTFTYEYDSAGRLDEIHLSSTELAEFTFNTLGQLVSETRHDTAPGQTYGYDAAGRLTSLAITGAGSNSVAWTYAYNPAGEVVSSTRDNDGYAFTDQGNVNRGYDANRLNQYDTVGADAVDYDTNGNLTNDSHTTFTYDPSNRLVIASGGNSATLKYDPLGRLFEVSSGGNVTQFLYDGADLTGEYNGSGTRLARYVHGIGAGDDPIIGYNGAGTTNSDLRQLYADRLGTVVLTTGYTGTMIGRATYDEWGLPGAANAGVGAGGDGRFQYTGQAWLPELGLHHYKARMYSPVLGRFMQTDPIGYGDGMNMYAYVGNSPTNAVDPSGNNQCNPNYQVPSGLEVQEEWIDVCGQRPKGFTVPMPGITTTTNVAALINSLLGAAAIMPPSANHAAGGNGSDGGTAPQNDDKACKVLRNNANAGKDTLPGRVTAPNIWNDIGWLRAYRHHYQVNADQWAVVASKPAQYVILAASLLPWVRAAKITQGVAGAAGTGAAGIEFSDRVQQQLEWNQNNVRQIDDRIDQLEGGC